jgi:hypothetical protein
MGDVFIGSEAVASAALTDYQLRRWYRPIFRDVYVPKRDEPSLDDRMRGAWLWSRGRAVIAGAAASALHGARWVDADTSVELIAKSARPQRGLIVRNEALAADEVTAVKRLPVTSVARTAFDLGRHLPRGQALARLDALMRATPYSFEDVSVLAKRYRGARGLRRLAKVLPLVDGGAASPKESWPAEPNDADTGGRRLAIGRRAGHGLGGLQGRRRIRRRPTPHRPKAIRTGPAAPSQTR